MTSRTAVAALCPSTSAWILQSIDSILWDPVDISRSPQWENLLSAKSSKLRLMFRLAHQNQSRSLLKRSKGSSLK